MKKTKLTLTILLSFTLILGQSESIKQWSELLGKMQHTIREDMSEQTDFDIDVKAIEVQINHLNMFSTITTLRFNPFHEQGNLPIRATLTVTIKPGQIPVRYFALFSTQFSCFNKPTFGEKV